MVRHQWGADQRPIAAGITAIARFSVSTIRSISPLNLGARGFAEAFKAAKKPTFNG
jgi:hypothetical protein